MGNFPSKTKRKLCAKDVRILTEKIRILREEINGMMHESEKESRASEREVMMFAFKEAEWKQQRKKLEEEVKKLRKNLEEKEEKITEMENGLVKENDNDEKEWQLLGTSFLMVQMKEERARRDEAVEKWKQLYLAIKTELDDLIQRTHGNGIFWRAKEEDKLQEMKMELKEKEEIIESLKFQLVSVENEVYRKEREIDILKQSFRIISCSEKLASRIKYKSFARNLRM